MKKLAIFIGAMILAGCGAETTDTRSSLSSEQRTDIADRLEPYGVVNLSAEPENFNGPQSAYVVNGEAVQVAAVAELPGKAKYAACAACHGNQGQGGIGPMLAGKSVDYIVGRLNAYRAGETVGAQSSLMWGQAAGLSDTDIADLAEYTASF